MTSSVHHHYILVIIHIDMKILVTGAAGYIGNFMTKRLLDEGYDVVAVDSLERGHKEVDGRVVFLQGDLRNIDFIKAIFNEHRIDGIIHFAAYIAMGESMQNPYIYFENNIQASLNLMEAAV